MVGRGSKDEAMVKLIQGKLGLKADGDFGPKTEAAVRTWQTNNGLHPTGVVDAKMLSMLGIRTDAATITSKLRGTVPDSVLDEVDQIGSRFGITTPLRLAHFLAQCAHESGSFKAVSENLNYSADGLKKIFGKYFPGDTASAYARKPEQIASRVYANRMGNGNEQSKDGWKYRGRGYLQLTGKSNYAALANFLNEQQIVNEPDMVASKYPLASAAFFFNNNKLWTTCDQGSSDQVVTAVTRRVNGGTNGLSDRIKYFKRYWSALSA